MQTLGAHSPDTVKQEKIIEIAHFFEWSKEQWVLLFFKSLSRKSKKQVIVFQADWKDRNQTSSIKSLLQIFLPIPIITFSLII